MKAKVNIFCAAAITTALAVMSGTVAAQTPVDQAVIEPAPALGGLPEQRPVILQQKWVAGQKLQYDVRMEGTADLQLPPDRALGMFAGLPLEMDVRGEGLTTLETLSVDDFGTGLVAVRIGQLNLKGQAFGQRGELNLINGRGQLKINEQAVGNEINWTELDQPSRALLLSRRGHLQGFARAQAPQTPNAATPAQGEAVPSAMNIPAMIQSVLLRALPALWPSGAVQKGDVWVEDIMRPTLPGATNAATNLNREVPGRVQFVLQGEEEIAGRKVQRIGLAGQIRLDRQDAAEFVENLPEKERQAATPHINRFDKAGQTFSGDLWFDPELGQVVRAEINLKAQLQGRNVTNPKAGGWGNFNGVLRMELKDVL